MRLRERYELAEALSARCRGAGRVERSQLRNIQAKSSKDPALHQQIRKAYWTALDKAGSPGSHHALLFRNSSPTATPKMLAMARARNTRGSLCPRSMLTTVCRLTPKRRDSPS